MALDCGRLAGIHLSGLTVNHSFEPALEIVAGGKIWILYFAILSARHKNPRFVT
jgi:hypothetical protein